MRGLCSIGAFSFSFAYDQEVTARYRAVAAPEAQALFPEGGERAPLQIMQMEIVRLSDVRIFAGMLEREEREKERPIWLK